MAMIISVITMLVVLQMMVVLLMMVVVLLMMVLVLMVVVAVVALVMMEVITRTAVMGTKVTKHLEHIEEELAIVLTELPEEDQQLLVQVHL